MTERREVPTQGPSASTADRRRPSPVALRVALMPSSGAWSQRPATL